MWYCCLAQVQASSSRSQLRSNAGWLGVDSSGCHSGRNISKPTKFDSESSQCWKLCLQDPEWAGALCRNNPALPQQWVQVHCQAPGNGPRHLTVFGYPGWILPEIFWRWHFGKIPSYHGHRVLPGYDLWPRVLASCGQCQFWRWQVECLH